MSNKMLCESTSPYAYELLSNDNLTKCNPVLNLLMVVVNIEL